MRAFLFARKSSCLIWFLALLLLCGAGFRLLIRAMDVYGRQIAPRKDIDLDTFLAEGPAPFRIERFLKEGQTNTVVTGKIPDNWASWIILPSGPPAYIFDESGKLIGFVSDTGESAWLRTWLSDAVPIPIQDGKDLRGP